MLSNMLGAARDLSRLRAIATVLARFGFADVVQRIGLTDALEALGERLNWSEIEDLAQMSPAQRLRRAMEELGPTFIKLGQLLSTRADLLAPDVIEELEGLQDDVPAVDFEELREQLESELGADVASVFASFDPVPLAAASIAQVHTAVLKDGSAVIVKIRRPGIRKLVEGDLRLMRRLADIAVEHLEEASRIALPELVEQFSRSISMEMDLELECRNADRMRANLERRFGTQDNPIVVPRVYWDLVGERVNVQERILGTAGRDIESMDRAVFDTRRLATLGARTVLQTILLDGFFHADPHPGNLFFLPGNRIAFIDFGAVAVLSERRRDQLIVLLHALVENDEQGVADVLMELASARADVREHLTESVAMFLARYHGLDLAQLDLPAMVQDLLALLRENELRLPAEFAHTLRVFITLEGLGRRLNPEFNLIEESAPVVREAFSSMYSPKALAERGTRTLRDGFRLLSEMPRELQTALRALSRGELKTGVEIAHLEELTQSIDRSISRLTVGLITAALIVGTAIVMTLDRGPQLFGLPLLGALGFGAAGFAGAWVMISIMRGK